MNYLKLIEKVKKKKYSNYLNVRKKFIQSYIRSRYQIIKKYEKIIKKENISSFDKFLSRYSFIKANKKISTCNYLTKLYLKRIRKKKLSMRDYKIIYRFYKKYETNLKLKKTYNYYLKRISNYETNIYSYIFLTYFLTSLNKINFFQKLNCFMKLNDHIILNDKKIKNTYLLKLFINNLKLEIILIKKIYKK